MPFEKGNTLGGRKKGSKNKATRQIREMVTELIEDNMERIKGDISRMESKERVNAVIQLMKFVLPTLKSQEIDLTTDMDFEPPQWLKDLDEDELQKSY